MGEGAGQVNEDTTRDRDVAWDTDAVRDAVDDEPMDRETARKLGEIEQTRTAMHETVEEIGDRLAPSTIVQNAKETVRDATVGKVEDMADSAGRMAYEAGYTVQQAGSGILETIRRNPIPAAMAGIGIAWLMTHRSNASAGPTYWDERRWSAGPGSRFDRRQDGGRGMTERVGDVGDSIGQRVGEVGDNVGQRLERVGDRFGDMPDEVSYRARDLGEQARTLMEDSPLAVGAAALAVGTAIGAALPATRAERRMLGPATERAVDTAERTAKKALADAEQGLRDVAQESRSSGASSSGSGNSSTSRPRSSGSTAAGSRPGG
jgi:hypothetical protein